jgi:hypothetical protein
MTGLPLSVAKRGRDMHRLRAVSLILCVILFMRPKADANEYLFVTFKDPGREGIWFAISDDALNWEMLNEGAPVLRTTAEMGVMRDPFVARGPDGVFHLIWTGGRTGFGYSRSPDLVSWTSPRRIPVWPGDSRVRNLWAPEIRHDDSGSVWTIFWSTTITGDFPATDGLVENGMNHRIYAMETRDFETVSEPRLFFDPGYPVIDATLASDPVGGVLMVFKDERVTPLHKQLRLTRAPSVAGPWAEPGAPLTQPWTEGPSLLQTRNGWLLFFDHYKPASGMKAQFSRDFVHWENVETRFPPLTKHGSFIKIADDEARRLRSMRPHHAPLTSR